MQNSTNSTNSINSKNPDLTAVIPKLFRAATRPIVTIIFAAVIAQVIVEKISAPDWFIALACGVILWWFGDRTVQHLKEKHVLERSEGKEQS